MSATRGMFNDMSQLKTRAPGKKLPSEETGLQCRAHIAVASALSTKSLAEALSGGGLRFMSAQIVCPMTLCAASMIAFAVGVCGVMLTAFMPVCLRGNWKS